MNDVPLVFIVVTLLLFSRFWFFKFAAAIGITVGAFFIPEGPFTTGKCINTHSVIYFVVYKKKQALEAFSRSELSFHGKSALN